MRLKDHLLKIEPEVISKAKKAAREEEKKQQAEYALLVAEKKATHKEQVNRAREALFQSAYDMIKNS